MVLPDVGFAGVVDEGEAVAGAAEVDGAGEIMAGWDLDVGDGFSGLGLEDIDAKGHGFTVEFGDEADGVWACF